jgi:hypothetical protein
VSISGNTGGNPKLGVAGTHVCAPIHKNIVFPYHILKIFLAGLALQLASFFLFAVVYFIFLYRVRKHAPSVWNPKPVPVWSKHWHTLALAIVVSCVGILVKKTKYNNTHSND